MVRVRNEDEFLLASIESVIDGVDDIVLVDNDSTDRTPHIIRSLADAHPDKITVHHYPHVVRRVGADSWSLAESPEAAASPNLSSNFYNWCLERCGGTHVLKWDGDMIALPALHTALTSWRDSERELMLFHGANVHPDRRHLIAARCTDRDELLPKLKVPGMPAWVTSLTYDAVEPRLFPKHGASYTYENRWTQKLQAPEIALERKQRVEGPCFLHLKFCKRDPWFNYSDDLAAVIAANIDVGPPLQPAWRSELERWGAS
jgi:hypothetical protein